MFYGFQTSFFFVYIPPQPQQLGLHPHWHAPPPPIFVQPPQMPIPLPLPPPPPSPNLPPGYDSFTQRHIPFRVVFNRPGRPFVLDMGCHRLPGAERVSNDLKYYARQQGYGIVKHVDLYVVDHNALQRLIDPGTGMLDRQSLGSPIRMQRSVPQAEMDAVLQDVTVRGRSLILVAEYEETEDTSAPSIEVEEVD